MENNSNLIINIPLKLWIAMGLILITFAGCGSGYAPKGNFSEVGYSETFYAADRGTIYYYGESSTTYEKVNDLALLRAAELALQRHYNYFVVIENKDITKQEVITTAGHSEKVESKVKKDGKDVKKTEQVYVPPSTNVKSKPAIALEVQFYITKPSDGFVYEASFIYKSIRQKYGIEK
jgi:hypothetical protein